MLLETTKAIQGRAKYRTISMMGTGRGGCGRGRPARWASIDDARSIVLDINDLRRKGFVVRCETRGAHLTTADGRIDLQLTIATDAREGEAHLLGAVETLSHGRLAIDQRVSLTTSVSGFGRRFWFRCPATGDRVGRLYLPNGANEFAGRRAYHLVYASTRLDRHTRLLRRARRLRVRLGADADSIEMPMRPPRMRWRTYVQAIARIEAIDAAAEAAWLGAAQAFLARVGR